MNNNENVVGHSCLTPVVMTDHLPLRMAIEQRCLPCLKNLIEVRADINQVESLNRTPLYLAISMSQTEMAQLLIKANALLNIKANFGTTALSTAVARSLLEVVGLLIEANANVNMIGSFGIPPLSEACGNANIEIVKRLLNAGAHVNPVVDPDQSPLFKAVGYSHSKANIVKELIRREADIHLSDVNGESALVHASRQGHVEIVQVLLEAQANPNGEENSNHEKRSPLVVALSHQRILIAKLLIAAKADPNMQDMDSGDTPLYAAAYHCSDYSVVEALLDAGAQTDIANRRGQTAAQGAQSYLDSMLNKPTTSRTSVPGDSPIVCRRMALAILEHAELQATIPLNTANLRVRVKEHKQAVQKLALELNSLFDEQWLVLLLGAYFSNAPACIQTPPERLRPFLL